MLEAGVDAPDFTAVTHEGKSLSLRDLAGRKVLLWFFPEAGTPGCTTEGISFRDQRGYFDEYNVALLGVSFNTIEENGAFVEKHGLGFPLLCDTTRALALAYGACQSPKDRYPERMSVLIDEQGRVARVYPSVDPRNHAAQVLVDLIDSV
ncbi:MAG TPA: peroxiredoxin [Candidatus Binataceae bacterium]|nr:peroxiredoxin [Candidatus Binataceae bacterium]